MSWDRGGAVREAVDFTRAFAIALPPTLVVAWMIGSGDAPAARWLWLALSLGVSALLAFWMRGVLIRRLRTVSSVLAAYREGDFSIRARSGSDGAPVHDVLRELNQLGDTLRGHRLGEMEAWTLLRKVMAEVDVVVLAFDDEGRVRLANDAALRVLGEPSPSILGKEARTLGLADLLTGTVPRVVKDTALGVGRWELRRGAFRLSGEPHSLVVLSDVSGALRDQERDAWKRLIRVMGHEINNSLAPIQSISSNLQKVLAESPRAPDWEEDMQRGLEVVARRAEALGRFMTGYAQLARLPPPTLRRIDVAEWTGRAVAFEQRLKVEIKGGPTVSLLGDADQLDQLLINLLKNAADASLETNGVIGNGKRGERDGSVFLRWFVSERSLVLVVEDFGPGVADTANLFVPFFTTKPGGTGIGLALARQIAEAHGGAVSLRTRTDGSGAEAAVTLPITTA